MKTLNFENWTLLAIFPIFILLLSERLPVMSNSWTVASQAPLSMGFSRPEYWSGLPRPSPGGLPNSGIELGSPALQANSLLIEPPGKPTKGKESLKV